MKTPGAEANWHGRPTSRELLEAVIGFLREQLPPHVDVSFHHQVRIAGHALEIVARELELGPGQLESHRARLEALGVTDDAELSDRIRSGEFDDRADLVDALRADSRDRLLVANPAWLPPEGNLG